MRICDKCKKDIGTSGYNVARYDYNHKGYDEYEFCRKCFDEYQKISDKLDREKDKKLQKWIKKEGA